MVTQKTRQCMEILATVASVPDGMTVTTQTLARKLGLSLSYLESLMRTLRECGLVQSSRGPGGGYQLTPSAIRLSLWDMLSLLEPATFEERNNDHAQPLISSLEHGCRAVLERFLSEQRLSDFVQTDPELTSRARPLPSGFRLGPMPARIEPLAPNSVFQLYRFLQPEAA